MWHYLTPGVDKIRPDDEFCVLDFETARYIWVNVKDAAWDHDTRFIQAIRRRIPDSVRRSMAFHALWQKTDGIQEGPGAYARWVMENK